MHYQFIYRNPYSVYKWERWEWRLIIWRLEIWNQKSQSGSFTKSFAFGVVAKEESDSPALRLSPGGSGWLLQLGGSCTTLGASYMLPAEVFRFMENSLPRFRLGIPKVYFNWPVPGRRLSTWIQVFPLSQPSLHLHVLTPPAASLVSCAIFFSSLGFSRLFACCVF